METITENNLITDAEKAQIEFILATTLEADQVAAADTDLSAKQLADAVSLGQVSLQEAIEKSIN